MAPVASQFPVLSRLLSSNSQWAVDVDKAEAGFFKETAKGQAPKVLWIGCADSRVPESVVTACKPGEIFVHRNIANQFHPDDDSANSVLAYAVGFAGVEHVVVVGHTKCGGAGACLAAINSASPLAVASAGPNAPINRWLAPLLDLAANLQVEPGADPSVVLTEESVRAQVANVCESDVISNAWASGKKVWVHGWVYEIEKGTLRDLGVSYGPE